HVKESSVLGLSEFFFGKPAVLGMPWQVVDPLIIALPLSTLTLILVWFLEKQGIIPGKQGRAISE
ncbi:MAG: hypothetical protein GKC03_02785, partial [Methanomassiliicoccales archaeon]|nr:hypothetical protein [Methanomassiliicoccales archaeon]